MQTNDEIIKRHNIRATIGTQNELIAEIKLIMDEVKINTTKLIFDGLNEIAEMEHGTDLESVLLREPCRNIKSVKKYKELISEVD